MDTLRKSIVMLLHFYDHSLKRDLKVMAFTKNVSQQEYVRQAISKQIEQDKINLKQQEI